LPAGRGRRGCSHRSAGRPVTRRHRPGRAHGRRARAGRLRPQRPTPQDTGLAPPRRPVQRSAHRHMSRVRVSEFQDDDRLVTTALEALAYEDVKVVATVPAQLPATAVPANARLKPFVSHTPLLAHAACAVTHGGAGAARKALAAGVPSVSCRSVATSSSRPPSQGRRRRHTTPGAAAKPGPAARQDPRSDDQDPRRTPHRRRLRCRRRTRRFWVRAGHLPGVDRDGVRLHVRSFVGVVSA